MTRRARRGVVLLEVIVAMTILVIAGISAVAWIGQVNHTLVHARETTNTARSASRYLDIIALWPREDLDRHLGERRQGEWLVTVGRPTSTLYEIAIRDTITRAVVLHTWLYRQETARVGP